MPQLWLCLYRCVYLKLFLLPLQCCSQSEGQQSWGNTWTSQSWSSTATLTLSWERWAQWGSSLRHNLWLLQGAGWMNCPSNSVCSSSQSEKLQHSLVAIPRACYLHCLACKILFPTNYSLITFNIWVVIFQASVSSWIAHSHLNSNCSGKEYKVKHCIKVFDDTNSKNSDSSCFRLHTLTGLVYFYMYLFYKTILSHL